jgi:hypothetical protein
MSALWLRAKSSFSTSNYGKIFAVMDTGKLQQTASRIQNKGHSFSFNKNQQMNMLFSNQFAHYVRML